MFLTFIANFTGVAMILTRERKYLAGLSQSGKKVSGLDN
jgi:hypothetical protein